MSTAEARVVKHYAAAGYIKLQLIVPDRGVAISVPLLEFYSPWNIFSVVKASLQILCTGWLREPGLEKT